jgi:hypothetical protein
MNKSAIFKAAHALTKTTIQAGDSYAVTFAAALRIVIADSKAPKSILVLLKEAGLIASTNEYKGVRTYINLKGQSYGDSQITKIWVNKAGDELNMGFRNGRESEMGVSARVAMANVLNKHFKQTHPQHGLYCWA